MLQGCSQEPSPGRLWLEHRSATYSSSMTDMDPLRRWGRRVEGVTAAESLKGTGCAAACSKRGLAASVVACTGPRCQVEVVFGSDCVPGCSDLSREGLHRRQAV